MLVNAGKTGDVPVRLESSGYVNIWHPDTWRPIADRMSFEKLVYLIKGLTLAQKKFSWIGGTKSSVIWLFQYVEEHYPEAVESVC